MATVKPPVIAYHVIFTTYGFWLPNDPRGSGSAVVRAEHLQEFGPATKVNHTRSAAGVPHDRAKRRAAKRALARPPVVLTGEQAWSVAQGFATQIRKSGYVVHACCVLPCHAHLVIVRHRYRIEQVGRLLRQSASIRLVTDGRHPCELNELGKRPTAWAKDFWKVYLYTPDDIRRSVRYTEDNPLKDGKRRQTWSFVTPYISRRPPVLPPPDAFDLRVEPAALQQPLRPHGVVAVAVGAVLVPMAAVADQHDVPDGAVAAVIVAVVAEGGRGRGRGGGGDSAEGAGGEQGGEYELAGHVCSSSW